MINGSWNIETYAAHNEALRAAEAKLQEERDRRYAEVHAAEEKALRVKQRADDQALSLAREIQAYKDEKANELRSQIEHERGIYVTRSELAALENKFDTAHKPVMEFIAANIGRSQGALDSRTIIAWGLAIIISLIAIGSFVFHASPSPQVIYMPQTPLPTTTTTTTIPAPK